VELFCSDGGQTVELWTCSVTTLDVVHVVLSDFILKGKSNCAFFFVKIIAKLVSNFAVLLLIWWANWHSRF
jgi:hypothetical protein